MKNIFTFSDIAREESLLLDKKNWTALVPMAGKGTRLHFDKPKALYPILGRSILDWMLSTLLKTCEKVVLVVSPEGKQAIENEVKRLNKESFVTLVEQFEPKGMADAILTAKDSIRTPHVLVVWGDQVTVKSKTLSICQSLLERNNAALSLPTFVMQNPYICFDRDTSGKLLKVRQKREGEVNENLGENDCGVFCFDTKKLFEVLTDKKNIGSHTKEYNLLPLLPFFDDNQNKAVTLRLESADETLGVNTAEDAKRAEQILSKR